MNPNFYKWASVVLLVIVIAIGCYAALESKPQENMVTISDVFVDVDADGDSDYVVNAQVLINYRSVLDFLPTPLPNQP